MIRAALIFACLLLSACAPVVVTVPAGFFRVRAWVMMWATLVASVARGRKILVNCTVCERRGTTPGADPGWP